MCSYILKNNIPSSIASEDYDDSISKSMYAGFMTDRCMICDRPYEKYYTKTPTGEMKEISKDKIQVGDELYFLCEKHGNYLLEKGQKTFDRVYVLEPLKVGNSMLEKINKKED